MNEYVESIGFIIALLVILIITMIPKKRNPKKKVFIEIDANGIPELDVQFKGYSEEEEKEILKLIMFECVGIQTKLEKHGKDETAEKQKRIEFTES